MKLSKPYLYNALEGMNFQSFTEIQKKTLPAALKGRDILGVSETGSGKTHAFLLPVFDRLDEDEQEVQSVIVSPTRELADQLHRFASELASYTTAPIDIRLYTGGRDRERELERLKKSQPQVVIGTPGKLVDLAVKENALKLYRARTFVIDEADMTLEFGFLKELETLANVIDKRAQLLVFSATLPEHLRQFVKKSMYQPLEVILSKDRLSKLNIRHRFIKSPQDKRLETLDRIIGAINPYLALVFANTIEEVDALASHLRALDLDVTKLHGNLTVRERKQAIREIEKLNVQYIAASDMAARGIDIDGVSHVVNLAFPKDPNFYIHRVGRTGRMGASGEAITLYDEHDSEAFDFLKQEGVTLEFCDIKDGEFIQSKQKPEKQDKRRPSKQEKIKPGYKKKHHARRKKGQS